MALLACLCAVHNHGSEMLFSFSAIVEHAPFLPVGFGILKAGLNKSVLLSVYASPAIRDSHNDSSYGMAYSNFHEVFWEDFLFFSLTPTARKHP